MDYHKLFIHLPGDEFRDCFQFFCEFFFVIINMVPRIFVYKSFCAHLFLLPWGKYLGVEWLNHMVDICLIFLKIAKLFPKWLYHSFYTPTSSV